MTAKPPEYEIRLPDQFDPLQTDIAFVFLDDEMRTCSPAIPPDELRYVRLTRRRNNESNDDPGWLDRESPKRWQERYGQLLPSDMFYHCWADILATHVIPYDGPTALTPAEQKILYCGCFGDLTMAMLYVMIEGLGWRPGQRHRSAEWPTREALLAAWRYWEDEDPEGSLLIALSVYAANEVGDWTKREEIEIARLAEDIDNESRATKLSR